MVGLNQPYFFKIIWYFLKKLVSLQTFLQMISKQINNLHADGKTKEELLEHIEITKTSYSDVVEILDILSKTFNIDEREALRQLLYSKADLDNSVKLIDKRDNKIYGLLIFSLFQIQNGSPIININPFLSDYLCGFSQLNGHSFVIDKRLRGCGVDKKMLMFQKKYIDKFDIVWCGVENDLKSHKYWEKLGFLPIIEDNHGIFYIKTKDKKKMIDIFIIKTLTQNENNHTI